jgi:hypothetical protein
MSVREIQKELDFSSPTLAVYHLDKLENMGFIGKSYGNYFLIKDLKIGVLSQIIKFGSVLLPRFFFYIFFFSSLLGAYLIFSWLNSSLELTMDSMFAILISITSIVIMIYECLRIWKQKRGLYVQ